MPWDNPIIGPFPRRPTLLIERGNGSISFGERDLGADCLS